MADLISVDGLLLVFFLVVIDGVFVVAGFTSVKLQPARMNALVDHEKPGAGLARDAVENLDGYLAVSQLGITLPSLGLGWIDELAVVTLIEPVLGEFLPTGTIHLVAFAPGFGFITFPYVVSDELTPKMFAIQGAERVALLVTPLMKFFYYVFVPGIVVFNGTANYFTSLFGVSPAAEGEETHSEEEILMILTRSEETGEIDLDKAEMTENIFELGDAIARRITIPRSDVEAISASMTLPELRSVATSGTYTWYIVPSEDGEQPIRFVHAKDILKASETKTDHGDPITTYDIIRDILVVPETRRIDAILVKFQTHGEGQIAVVIDEWDILEGIVIIEDILEEIVGNIRDEFDTAPRGPTIEERDDGTYVIDGGVPVQEVNERLGVKFETDGVETIGGFVFSRLGREPEIAGEIEQNGYVLHVDSIDNTRVERLVIRPPEWSQKQTIEEG